MVGRVVKEEAKVSDPLKCLKNQPRRLWISANNAFFLVLFLFIILRPDASASTNMREGCMEIANQPFFSAY